MRKVHIKATWETTHTIEVPDDAPKIEALGELIEYEDIDSAGADLVNWEIRDDG